MELDLHERLNTLEQKIDMLLKKHYPKEFKEAEEEAERERQKMFKENKKKDVIEKVIKE